MIITIIGEPRSGTYNLHNWMIENLHGWDLLFEPKDLREVDTDKNYVISVKYFEENLAIVRTAHKLGNIIVAITREDEKGQIESAINAHLTGTWYDPYTIRQEIIKNIDTQHKEHKDFLLKLKREFKEYITSHNLKHFTYEDLYYRGKIREFIDYVGLDINAPFPYGKKYRTNPTVINLI